MGIHQQANSVRRDVYPDAAWAAVKLAIRQTVAKAGCLDAVAKQCRVSHKARVSEWQNPYSDDFPNLWQVGQLEGLAGVDWITEAMCAAQWRSGETRQCGGPGCNHRPPRRCSPRNGRGPVLVRRSRCQARLPFDRHNLRPRGP